ncbi:signal recognition particle-docking protein FtsY [Burkholderia oklahomensis]|uniref:signal recognition particle-docking protein FtsY n=2 Tax=Burkholderia oklahomensis TaxID=342113 RepID=UPI0005D803C3|nr:signal recognition particle-docking protein FtsY [Burkholderia oklahomensis]AJX33218.1 signal recognition particle-docking protein FtsY [Burkholderia oklahomensis C6786]AOI47189.1 signal recognition particle-docking protein FtsY [Burkholderia oklahomensis C6786]KUY63593.1 signal recognition particle-docking protein FtsY [Burkholderia oklahomensis C6786]MBI0360126.1 signal recognition particle-docking protein FtsY [Burkholderia oklahomensis]SUW59509.1 Cell division protein FtsY homolog [Burk
MFSFFKRFKKAPEAAPAEPQQAPDTQPDDAGSPAAPETARADTPATPVARDEAPAAAPSSPVAQPSAAASAPATPPAASAATPEPRVQQRPSAEPARPSAEPAPSVVMTVTPSANGRNGVVETVEIVPPPTPEPAAKQSWLARLKSGLAKTSSSITNVFVNTKIDEALYEELETALLMSDAGVDATEHLLDALREKVRTGRLTDPQQVKDALRGLLVDLLKPLEKSLMLGRAQPLVMMIAGVNGAGKTTSIGKLAKHLQSFDQSVLLAAGDTFRAAAREQLAIWGERNNVTVVQQESGDPAAVIFDAVSAARARNIDVMMADTAGRLPTQLHLMEELRKVKRVIGKAHDGAPHEVLLVIDANTGQNGLAQVKAFDDALGLTGLIVTKLDGTAKGGILAAIARQRPIPVYFIGVGEKVEDLQPFSAEEFADALLG